MSKKANVIGIDNNELGLKFAEEFLSNQGLEAELILASAYQTTLPNNSVDFVIASEIIEHVKDPGRLLKETQRVLKPDGMIIITTPYRLTEQPMDPFHYKEFYPNELEKLIGAYFKEIEVIESQPAFWFCLYTYELKLPLCRHIYKCRNLLRYLINFSALYFNKNPFLKDSSHRKKREFYTQIFIKAKK